MVAPVITLWTPTGTVDPDTNLSVRVFDNDSDFDTSTVQFNLTDPDLGLHDIIINGVFQAGFTGTINQVGKELFIGVTDHDLFKVGTWEAYFSVDDLVGGWDDKLWNFDIDTNDIQILNKKPSGVKTGTLDQISFVLIDDWGLDVSSLNMTMVSPTSQTLTVISAGVIQSDFTGVIIELNDAGDGPKNVEVIIKSWPTLLNGALWTFNVDINNAAEKPI